MADDACPQCKSACDKEGWCLNPHCPLSPYCGQPSIPPPRLPPRPSGRYAIGAGRMTDGTSCLADAPRTPETSVGDVAWPDEEPPTLQWKYSAQDLDADPTLASTLPTKQVPIPDLLRAAGNETQQSGTRSLDDPPAVRRGFETRPERQRILKSGR
jgi:hypothetical protein